MNLELTTMTVSLAMRALTVALTLKEVFKYSYCFVSLMTEAEKIMETDKGTFINIGQHAVARSNPE